MKYIVTKQDETGYEEIFVFPSTVNHDCFAEGVHRMKNQSHGRWQRVYRTPIAAGFTDGVVCQGYSETLNLKSRGEVDAALLKV
jgi:hypothetical protein